MFEEVLHPVVGLGQGRDGLTCRRTGFRRHLNAPGFQQRGEFLGTGQLLAQLVGVHVQARGEPLEGLLLAGALCPQPVFEEDGIGFQAGLQGHAQGAVDQPQLAQRSDGEKDLEQPGANVHVRDVVLAQGGDLRRQQVRQPPALGLQHPFGLITIVFTQVFQGPAHVLTVQGPGHAQGASPQGWRVAVAPGEDQPIKGHVVRDGDAVLPVDSRQGRADLIAHVDYRIPSPDLDPAGDGFKAVVHNVFNLRHF